MNKTLPRSSRNDSADLNGVDAPRTQPPSRRRITWQDPNDVRALVIASLGFSNKAVNHYCNLSNGQIYYRLRLANLTRARSTFRDGTSPVAKAVMARNADLAEERVQRSLRKQHQTQPIPSKPQAKS